ncbi:peptidyl-prolyl cis-trans isomerase, FKBP-type [gut metagenome]|uniref:peptidylprolyl isomerase n=1 Tax=gut metagenome TaxID=749906 RepID=J9F7K5_9ZZZZ
MQIKSFLLIALAATCSVSASAQKNKKKSKKQAKKALVQATPKHEAVDGKTFSYALGIAQGPSLKQYLQYQLKVDSAYIDYFVKGMTDNLTEAQRMQQKAYAAGLQIAEMNMKNLPEISKAACGKADSVYVDQKEFERALAQVLLGQTTAMNADSAAKVVEKQFQYQQDVYKQANLAWLEANKQLKGVKILPSGLQYRVLTAGKGPVATDSTEVEVHYEGKLIDGTVFDSSYKRNQPATFRPDQVIKGWREALTLLPEGTVVDLYIPSELGYGERGSGQHIPGNSTLIFKVEILKVKNDAAKK